MSIDWTVVLSVVVAQALIFAGVVVGKLLISYINK